MNKLQCLIVEDEPLAAEVLKEYIDQTPFLQRAGVASDAFYAMEIIANKHIDLILLDIHLPLLKGLDLIKTLPYQLQVIITTAYREYALDGYELNVVDYLLKPVSYQRFLAAANKARIGYIQKGLPLSAITPAERRYFLINVNKKKIKIFLDRLLYVESRKEYSYFVTKDQSYLAKIPLGDIAAQLKENNFIRVHRSFIVSKDKITAFTALDVEINDMQIPIGRSYRDFVLHELGES